MSFGLHFLHCGAYPHCSARVDKHFDGYHTLQLMTSGAVELFYDEKRRELRCDDQNWFWPAFPGPRIRFHAAREVSSWNHRYAAFSGPLVGHWKDADLWPDAPQIAPRALENTARMDEILAHIQSGDPWGTRRAIGELEALLLELAQARDSRSGELWLESARRWLRETPDFTPDYSVLARELGLGLSTLSRNFRAATGQSLHAYALQLRLADARRLLGETDLPLKAIAHKLGYSDPFFFSAQFKKLAGVSPATYRKSRQ